MIEQRGGECSVYVNPRAPGAFPGYSFRALVVIAESKRSTIRALGSNTIGVVTNKGCYQIVYIDNNSSITVGKNGVAGTISDIAETDGPVVQENLEECGDFIQWQFTNIWHSCILRWVACYKDDVGAFILGASKNCIEEFHRAWSVRQRCQSTIVQRLD